jgi:hypothetical protein
MGMWVYGCMDVAVVSPIHLHTHTPIPSGPACSMGEPVQAQGGDVDLEKLFGQRVGEGFSLLLIPKAQKELGLTRGQALRVIARDQAAEGLMETSPPSKPEDIPLLTRKQQEIREKAVAEILDERQRQRLLQLMAQQQGAPVLLRKEVEQALGLGDAQRFALYSIHKETIEKVKALPPEGRSAAAVKARQAKLRKIRLAGYNHMLRALTPDQRAKLRAYLGPPVSLE